MLKAIGDLKKSYNSEAIKVFLMTALVATYPLLEELGFGISAPLTVIVHSERTIPVLTSQLCGFSKPAIIPVCATPKEFKLKFEESEYGLKCFRFGEGRYTPYNMETIFAECQRIENDISRRSLKIIFRVGKMPLKFQAFLGGFVFIKESPKMNALPCINSDVFLKKLIRFCLAHIPEIKRIRKKLTIDMEGFDTLEATAEILKLLLQLEDLAQNKIDEIQAEFDQVLSEMRDEWECIEDPRAYAIVFRQAICRYAREFNGVFDREHVPGEVGKKLELSLLFDEYYYYVSSAILDKMIKMMPMAESPDFIKEQLVNAGVIVGEGRDRSYFSKKIEIVLSYGYVFRKRLVKLVRKMIDIPGELTLEQKIMMEREGETDENQVREDEQLRAICDNFTEC